MILISTLDGFVCYLSENRLDLQRKSGSYFGQPGIFC